jgi:hypothetical protein
MSITRDIETARTGTRQVRVMKDSRATAAPCASDVIQWFLDYYWIRHPISESAMVAYRADLVALEEWLLAVRNSSLQSAGAKDLRAFLDSQYRDGRSAGHIPSVSCIKRFLLLSRRSWAADGRSHRTRICTYASPREARSASDHGRVHLSRGRSAPATPLSMWRFLRTDAPRRVERHE